MLDVPVLAQGVARFIGEQVAAVAADDEDIAQRALDLIEVEYEERPAVLTMDEAKAEGAPLVHEDMLQVKGYPKEVTEPNNVYTVWEWAKGDVDAGMAEADVIVENTFTTPRQHQAYLEPHTCLVAAHPSGKVDVWAANKSPHPGQADGGHGAGAGRRGRGIQPRHHRRRLRRQRLRDGDTHRVDAPPRAPAGR